LLKTWDIGKEKVRDYSLTLRLSVEDVLDSTQIFEGFECFQGLLVYHNTLFDVFDT